MVRSCRNVVNEGDTSAGRRWEDAVRLSTDSPARHLTAGTRAGMRYKPVDLSPAASYGHMVWIPENMKMVA